MKFQTRGVLKNHKLRVCCFRNWLQNKPCCKSVNSSKTRMCWKDQKWKEKSGDMFKRFNFLVFSTWINDFFRSCKPTRQERNNCVQLVFKPVRSYCYQSVSEKSKIISTEHFHYMITSEGIEDSRCQWLSIKPNAGWLEARIKFLYIS